MEFWKGLADIAQSVAVMAVAVGGALLYLRRRQRFPRARMAHQILHRRISEGQFLVFVIVAVTNLGEVIIRLTKGFTRIRQVTPGAAELLGECEPDKLRGCDLGWLMIDEKLADLSDVEIEPNEDQEFCFEFIVSSEAETISIYSHFENEKKTTREIGWNKTSWYDLNHQPTATGGLLG